LERVGETKKIEKGKWRRRGKNAKRRRAYRKIKSKSSRRLIERIKGSSDKPLVFVKGLSELER